MVELYAGSQGKSENGSSCICSTQGQLGLGGEGGGAAINGICEQEHVNKTMQVQMCLWV